MNDKKTDWWKERYKRAQKLPWHRIFTDEELQEANDYSMDILERHPGDPDATVIGKLIESHRLLSRVAEAYRLAEEGRRSHEMGEHST